MTTIDVFDPPMCCSTGVCGPNVDPKLVRFASDLDWLKQQGVAVRRFNAAQEPKAFADNAVVAAALQADPAHALPLVLVNGAIASRGVYPGREQLAAWAGVKAAPEAPAAPKKSCCGSSGCC